MKAYQIHISLEAVTPPVWRRAVIPAGIAFSRLASILNDIMGWMGDHLFSVTAGDGYCVSGIPEYEDIEELSESWGYELSGGDDLIDPIFTANQRLSYVYDLGDRWEHRIEVEALLEDYPCAYPQVLDGDGACPPDEIGGAAAYMDIAEHPERFRELWELLLYEMEDFDPEETNHFLREFYGSGEEAEKSGYESGPNASACQGEEVLQGLEEALQYYRVEDLKCICRELGIRGYSGLRKRQIVELLLSQMADKEVISNALLDMGDMQMELLEDLMEAPRSSLGLPEEARRAADEFLRRGLVFQALPGVYFAPEEIGRVYDSIDKEELSRRRGRVQLVLHYCRAAVNLYGIVEIEHLLKVFNEQNEEALFFSELSETVALAERQEGCPIKLTEGYLYDAEIDWETFDILLEQQEGKPYYVPPKEEFLKYSDFYYCEKPLAWKAMEHFFKNDMELDPFKADLLCHELEMLSHIGASTDIQMGMLDVFDVPKTNIQHLSRLMELFHEAWKCTRTVLNRGFTPNEMQAAEDEERGGSVPDNVIPFPFGRLQSR